MTIQKFKLCAIQYFILFIFTIAVLFITLVKIVLYPFNKEKYDTAEN